MRKTKFTIIPVPYEATTTYGKGTKKGPEAILRALPHVEEFDEELKREIFDLAEIQIVEAVKLSSLVPRLSSLVENGKIPIVLGGEHSITPQIVKQLAKKHKDLSVLQLDAHADLRDHYKGRKDNHACAMRRILEICPAVQAGIRNMSKWCYLYAKKSGQLKKIHLLNAECRMPNVELMLKQLSKNVYITIDVDVFDPSVIPAVGTPEPGGLLWHEVLDILRGVCRAKNVVGFDVMELSPIKGLTAPDFMAAKLIYKLIGYIASKATIVAKPSS